ncbi:patatin-like phospholipase family protein, partial [Acinetobacter baumannii]
MRQLAPISPAIHLGAEKILVIGGGQSQLASQSNAPGLHMHGSNQYPSLAQISGHALSSIFLDSLSGDIERLQR